MIYFSQPFPTEDNTFTTLLFQLYLSIKSNSFGCSACQLIIAFIASLMVEHLNGIFELVV